MNIKNNSRRRESRRKISKVFIEMLQTKEISKITVSDICKRADINRSTFYANFADVYELADKLRYELESQVNSLYGADATQFNSNNWIVLFKHIQDNQLFYKTYFKLGYDRNKVNLGNIDPIYKELYSDDLEYHIEFFKAGFNAIVKRWLDGGCKESPEHMHEILASEYRGSKL